MASMGSSTKAVFSYSTLIAVYSLRGGHFVFGDDRRDLIPVITDMPVEHQTVCRILMRRICAPGMARCGKGDFRNIKTGDDLHDAFDFFRF